MVYRDPKTGRFAPSIQPQPSRTFLWQDAALFVVVILGALLIIKLVGAW